MRKHALALVVAATLAAALPAAAQGTSLGPAARAAAERALNTGQPQTWRDPRTGAAVRVEVIANGFDDRYVAPPSAGDFASNVSATDLRYARGVQRIHSGFQGAAPLYVSPGRVNLRAAPAAGARVIGRLRPGQQIQVVGMVNGRWLAVTEAGRVKGYVAGSAVRASAPTAYVRNMDSPFTCRLVQQTVSRRGQATDVRRFNACQDSTGLWRLHPV